MTDQKKSSPDERHPLLRRPLYVYDLPSEIRNTLQQKTTTTHHSFNDALQHTPKESDPYTDISHEDASPKSTSCSLCGLTFTSLQDQRSHVRSDLHGYNMKQRMRNAAPVSEADFEKLIGNLDESLSGSDDSSDSDESEDERKDGNMLSALLRKQANLTADATGVVDEEFGNKRRKRGAGKPPLVWFETAALPADTALGIYRALFTVEEQAQTTSRLEDTLRAKQIAPAPPPKVLDEGGIALPQTMTTPHIFLCMIGGGHFAGMVVSLAPKLGKKHGSDERQATVLAHKTFHRYTTRRKQGGAQSANDSAKGAAHSAGSTLRRYNEAALTNEVRELLTEWAPLIKTSQLLFVRATGSTNRRTLFGPYDGQVLRQNDPRNRGFPFSTRRPTQAELMRCFVELTRVQISTASDTPSPPTTPAPVAKPIPTHKPKPSAAEEAAALHSSQLSSLIRRAKAPALLSYLATNGLAPSYPIQNSHHAPTPLHLSASLNHPALVTALLLKAHADPTMSNDAGKTAFELAGDRPTRDAFRSARASLGEHAWSWMDARVPEPLSAAEVAERAAREKEEEAAETRRVREEGMTALKEEEARREKVSGTRGDARRIAKHGSGFMLNEGRARTAEERREEEARGLTPEVRMKLERERRARAAEERMKKVSR